MESAYGVLSLRPRRPPRGHLNDGAPEGPDVDRRALLLPARHLWRHEHGRAAREATIRLVAPPRASEVGELGPAAGAEQHVLALDVAVGDAGGVEVGESAEDVAGVGSDGGLRKPAALLLDGLGERAASGVLHEEVETGAKPGRGRRDFEAQVGDDKGRVERGKNALLALQGTGAGEVRGLDGEHLAGGHGGSEGNSGGGSSADGEATAVVMDRHRLNWRRPQTAGIYRSRKRSLIWDLRILILRKSTAAPSAFYASRGQAPGRKRVNYEGPSLKGRQLLFKGFILYWSGTSFGKDSFHLDLKKGCEVV